MEGAILHTNSASDLNLLLQIAKKLGINTRKLTKDELEDYGYQLLYTKEKPGDISKPNHS
ncbi:MAG: hypothetical protein K8R53_06600 [Bacteroidales bacterium]|nr:hypothetical protein [Bacteroidales bacterium]